MGNSRREMKSIAFCLCKHLSRFLRLLLAGIWTGRNLYVGSLAGIFEVWLFVRRVMRCSNWSFTYNLGGGNRLIYYLNVNPEKRFHLSQPWAQKPYSGNHNSRVVVAVMVVKYMGIFTLKFNTESGLAGYIGHNTVAGFHTNLKAIFIFYWNCAPINNCTPIFYRPLFDLLWSLLTDPWEDTRWLLCY